jgi:hypothetical protein
MVEQLRDVIVSHFIKHAVIVSSGLAMAWGAASSASAQSFGGRSDRSFDAQFRQADKNRDQLKSSEASDEASSDASVKDDASDDAKRTHSRMKFYSGAAVLGGHDSNVDMNKAAGSGTSFGMVDLGAAVVVGGESSQTTAIARGSFARHNMEFRPERWDGGFLVDHYMKMSGGWKVHLGGFLERNEIEIDRPMYAGAYAQVAKNGQSEDAFVRLRSMQTQFGNPISTPLSPGFLSDVDASFTNTRSEVSAGMLLLKDRALAPFFELSAARIQFSNQIDTAVLNRNANEFYGIAGVRITLGPKLHIDLGGRVNNRDLDDQRAASHTGAFFDGKIVWSPTDRIDVEVNVDRKNTEAMTANALFTERTAADVQVTAKLNEKVKARVEVGMAKLDQIGLNKNFEERYVEGRIGYQINKRIELFSMAKAEEIKDSTTGDVIDRVRVGAGVKVGF